MSLLQANVTSSVQRQRALKLLFLVLARAFNSEVRNFGCALIPLALIFSLTSTDGFAQSAKDPLAPSKANLYYRKAYSFSADWFTHNIPLWQKALGHLKGKASIHYLEIGVFEGRSALWMLENILTAPTAKMTCIDIFPGDLQEKFLANLRLSGFFQKATAIKGQSQIELRKLPINSFDIVYIDGSHAAKDVLTDAVLSWELLRTGGIMIFDDYEWETNLPARSRPQIAIDSFIAVFGDHIEIIHHGYQVMLKKMEKKN